MCDTLVAIAPATARGGVLFGKNSDRERNEAQVLEMQPRRNSGPGGRVRLTYIDIAEAPRTHACLISRPFWMWGAEMGANEHGVVIGNEAMHATIPAQRKRALTGMDLVRLGLERGATAAEAVAVMTALLEQHGQGGDCGHRGRFYYQNGFVIADPTEAYVLETVGRWWVVEKVSGVRTLSNALSIGEAAHAVSPALAAHAQAEGWSDGAGRFNFAGRLLDPVKDAATFGQGRCARAANLLAPKAGRIDVADALSVLRDHGAEAGGDSDWSPRKTLSRSICMHAAHGGRRSQTVSSMASDLTPGRTVHWVTATAAPCLSLFKPVVMGVPLAAQGPPPSDRFDGESLWWRHERMHRAALARYPAVLATIAAERDAAEVSFRARMETAWAGGEAAVARAVTACWREAEAIEAGWLEAVWAGAPRGPSAIGRPAALAWARLNGVAGFPTA
ncbi:MAG: dipeptidase [Caulobacter sp.]|nr:dipeptidase [Caulobacter sp.]